MQLSTDIPHPNGFKIAIALNVSGQSAVIKNEKGIYEGAALKVRDPCTKALLSLAPNSAVLFLLSSPACSLPAEAQEQWLSWEASHFQRTVLAFLQNASSGKADQTSKAALAEALARLESHLSNSPYIDGQSLGASDVVLGSSLLLLPALPPAASLLAQHTALTAYVHRLADCPAVKKALESWFSITNCAEIPVKQLVTSGALVAPPPLTTAANVLALLKTSPQVPSTGAPQQAVTQASEERKISAGEVEAAKRGWEAGADSCLRKSARAVPVLPVPGERNTMVTSALPYVNNVPHLGNIIGCVLSADCYARFCRLRGDNVIYICGTDEYGTATETKAIGEGLTPQQICDKYHQIHAEVYKNFNISFDHFGRTTCPSQTEIVHELFWDLEKAGKISRDSVEQQYCDHCSRFLADRFVEGTCPHPGCGYEDARGDQCDGCGKLVNAAELVSPRCKLCSKTPRIKVSNHLFIDLPKIEDDMRKWFSESSKKWSSNASSICNTWLRDGLLPRCITRDLKWGVPVPLEGYTDKVFYVWFDAPIGYLSITKEYTKEWEKWWKNPEQVKLYQFMAKDNVPFHGVIFPCTLTGSPKAWTRVTNLMATEYLNYEDGKFSKSRGVGVFGNQAMETGIPSDVWRFYLLYIRPESQDTAFSWSDLQMKNNTELLNNLGNFVNRSLKFVSQFYNGCVPEAKPTESDFKVIAAVNHELANYLTALSNVKLRDGLRCILSITRIGNQYIQDNEPYKLIKPDRSPEDKERGASVISLSVNIVYLVALCLHPYMPDTSGKILEILNLPDVSHWRLPTALPHAVPAGCKVTKPEPLIKKITDDELKQWQAQFQGTDDGSSKSPAKKKPSSATPAAAACGSADLETLQRMVAEQGEKVRALKAGGATKADIAADVAVLLQLKQQLALAQGTAPPAPAKDKKQKSNAQVPVANGVSTSAETERLQALVTEQGEVVRGLKSSGASKEAVSAAVAELLQRKTQLAAALGVDPASLSAPSKSGKKKK